MNGLLARASVLAGLLVGLAPALPSDALLDSLQIAALEQEKEGRFDERDRTETLLERLARQRVVADSAPELPRKRLDELDALRLERGKREAQEEDARRKPPAEVVKLLTDTVADTPQASALPAVPGAPTTAPAATSVSAPASASASVPRPLGPTCPQGAVKFRWIEPTSSVHLRKGESAMDVRIRLEAPCGLTRIELYADDLPPRPFPSPRSGAGAFEFSDRIPATEGIHHLEVLACDTLGGCSRSQPMEARLVGSVPSWVPKVVGGLVGLCGLLGLALFLRRRPHPLRPQLPGGRPPMAVPVPESKGLTGTLRKRLQQVAQEVGPAFPAVSLRLPDVPPSLGTDPESLADAFSTLLRLHARRTTGSGGQILIAMGMGPVSVEVVFEDTASSPEEGSVQAILDLARPRVRERMGLDHELETALEAFHRAGGSITNEVRIDGGLRTRMKIPLGQVKPA